MRFSPVKIRGEQEVVCQALFIRSVSVSPQNRQVDTRYGSRENCAFSSSRLSVRISIRMSCGVALPHTPHRSLRVPNVDRFVDIQYTEH